MRVREIDHILPLNSWSVCSQNCFSSRERLPTCLSSFRLSKCCHLRMLSFGLSPLRSLPLLFQMPLMCDMKRPPWSGQEEAMQCLTQRVNALSEILRPSVPWLLGRNKEKAGRSSWPPGVLTQAIGVKSGLWKLLLFQWVLQISRVQRRKGNLYFYIT